MLALVAVAGGADAQGAPGPIAAGDRVRVTCPTLAPEPIIGTLKSANEQELVVERANGPVTLRRDAVVAFEKSLGRRPRRSTRIGGAVLGGLLIAGTFGQVACAPICAVDAAGRCLDSDPCGLSTAEEVFTGAAVAVGAAVGFGVGSLFKTEKWEKVGGPALALEAAPTRGGARVALRFGF